MPGEQSLDDQVAALKKRIGEAQDRRKKAETQAAVADDRVAQAVNAIHAEFSIDPEQAPARLEELRADLAAQAERVRAALERAEASE